MGVQIVRYADDFVLMGKDVTKRSNREAEYSTAYEWG